MFRGVFPCCLQCHPAFGLREDALSSLYRLGLIDYSTAFTSVWESLRETVESVRACGVCTRYATVVGRIG